MAMPDYFQQDRLYNQGQMFGNGLGSLLGGIFGDSGRPYHDASNQYNQYVGKAENIQNPFLQAGQQGLGNYQSWLQGQQNPSQFINNLMNQYQESPFAHYQQQQGIRQAQNLGSATGLSGSTPLQMQAQQNAQNISSGDMQNWLARVLGINTQYGAGQQNLMNSGQNATNALTQLYGNAAGDQANLAYNQGQGKQNDFWGMLGGGASILGSLFL